MADAAGALLGSIEEDLRYELKVSGIDGSKLTVVSFESTDGLSRLFTCEVVVSTAPDDVGALDDALGSDASFCVAREGRVEHVVHGIVSEVIPDGAFVGRTTARTTLVIEPRLANLRYSGGFRIFQSRTVREIVEELVKPENIEIDWRLRPALPTREYRTQQDETDYAFLARLAADEGLHFFFEHSEEKTTLVFTNSPKGFGEMERSTFSFRDTEGAVSTEHVRSIRRVQRLGTGAVEHRDFDFRKPRLVLKGRKETGEPDAEATTKRREIRDYPGGFEEQDQADQANARAQMRLEELRSGTFTLAGTASTLRFAAGKQFTLTEHRDERFNVKMRITDVQVGGTVAGSLVETIGGNRRAATVLATFGAVPAEHPLRPPRIPKPASRLQTARVVGPSEGDPFVDEFGRVKVQFAWDREGAFDEHSSCFIRMMTPVAHGDEGWFSAHKVGSEVLVDFIDGDIDRPVVMGALYNGKERQPYKQPDEVAKSSWKVKSIPGGKGFNELTFDNTAGHERIFLHAQKDRVSQTLHDHTESVGANQSTAVGANQSVAVGADQSIAVGAKRSVTVKKSEEITVSQGRTTTIKDKDDSLTVTDGNRVVGVSAGNHTRTVKQTDTTQSKDFVAHASNSVTVTGDVKVQMNQKSAAMTMEGEKVTVQAPSTIVIDCSSGAAFFKDNKITIQATDELVLQCGQSKISLKKDGTIAIQGGKLVTAQVSDSSIKLDPAKAAVAGASVEVNAVGQAKIAGAIVKIN